MTEESLREELEKLRKVREDITKIAKNFNGLFDDVKSNEKAIDTICNGMLVVKTLLIDLDGRVEKLEGKYREVNDVMVR